MMKKLITYINIACSVFALQAQTTEHHGALEVSYPSGVDLLENTVLGVNGRVFIYNGTTDIALVNFNADIVKDFALVVAGNTVDAYEDDGITPIMIDDPNNPGNLIQAKVEQGGGIVSTDLGLGSSELYIIPDYVFEEDYELKSLEEVEAYVKENKHLPDVIGKDELEEQGYFMVTEMLFGQLKNLEELILHTIEQEKKIKVQEAENQRLRELAEELEKRLEALEANKQ